MPFLRVGFRQNGFFAFLAGFFLLIFVGKSAQKNPPGKSPAKSSKIYTTKIPDTFLQRGRANMPSPSLVAEKQGPGLKLSSQDDGKGRLSLRGAAFKVVLTVLAVVLANVPSFRFSFRGNMRMYPRSSFRSGGASERTLVPVCVPGEHPPKSPFWKPPF